MIRSGAVPGFKEGFILGSEVAGTVTAAGDGVDTSWLGERVWGSPGVGGYSEQTIAPAEVLVRLPANVSAVEAVTLGSRRSWRTSASAVATSFPAKQYWCVAQPAASGS
jgi:NADPH2:quinone reductase